MTNQNNDFHKDETHAVGYDFNKPHGVNNNYSTNKNNPGANINRNTPNGLERNANKDNISDIKSTKKDVPNRLKNSKGNKLNNLLLANKWGKKQKSKEEKDQQASEQNRDDNDEEESNHPLEGYTKRKIRLIKIKIFLSLIVGLLIVIFLIAIIGSIASLFGITISFNSIDSYGSSDFESVTDKDSETYDAELNYYSYLQEATNSYKDSCGIVLNTNYIHSVLTYRYSENGEEFYKNLVGNEKTTNKNIDTIVKLMVNNCAVDYNSNGSFYARLKNSSFFKEYYKDMLTTTDADKILEGIFSISELSSELYTDYENDLYVSDTLKVNLSSGTTIRVKDYLKGVLYNRFTEIEITESNLGTIKAYAIGSLTNLLYESSYTTNMTSINVNTNNCDASKGCYKVGVEKLDASKLSLLDKVINEVFGIIIVSDSGFKSVDLTVINSVSDKDYQQIISNKYSDYSIEDISEDNYSSKVDYHSGKVKYTVVFYDQNDYDNVAFCGRSKTRPATIKSAGCGVVAMAIVTSTLIDKSYDPIKVMEDAYAKNYCGVNISGTSPNFFKYEAEKLGLNYQYSGKNQNGLNNVISTLSSGKALIIVKLGPGTFTSSGHYVVISEMNADTGKVYIYDPNQKSNLVKRGIGNGWYDFNEIVKETRAFYIISKG